MQCSPIGRANLPLREAARQGRFLLPQIDPGSRQDVNEVIHIRGLIVRT